MELRASALEEKETLMVISQEKTVRIYQFHREAAAIVSQESIITDKTRTISK